ncbi:MAG: PEP-CTERM system histidine kinase PrsK [Acidobacteria bacterium]|nr:PEP-CTERM system histidine kinase PrsK [Acidobacteriota bacterium]
MIHWIDAMAFIAGLGLSFLLALFPRFGPGSRYLLFFVLPACFSAVVQTYGMDIAGLSRQNSLRLSFAFIIATAAGGYLASSNLNRKAKRSPIAAACIVSLLLIIFLYQITPPYVDELQVPEGYLALGLVGYISALFLLITSVIVLANIEQILRRSSETVRWELKFLFIGMAALYAAIIYMSAHTLLFAPRNGYLLSESIELFHTIFIVSCILIAISWKRGSGRSRIAVSHGAIYSSITLLSVGVYLIASSLIARWVSRYGDIGLPVEALIFLVSAVVLVVLYLGTGFRHRTRAWIRRNIFAGKYDYRQFWLEATERVRSIDPQEVTAAAMADIVHRALGAIDISVWIRHWNPNRLHLLSSTGTISDSLDSSATGVIEQLLNASEPLSADDLESMEGTAIAKDFMEKTRASLLVPLLSSNRIVGVLTVGPDRSGHPYDWEAREFLRALAGHAAGEFHKSDLLSTLVAAKEDEAFRTFSTFLLHDLKNFASTLSYIAQNAPRHQHNPDFQRDSFQSVYDTAEKMKRLCNSLRTFSSNLAADKKLADLNQIVRSVADTLNAGISKYLQLETGDLPPVLIDSEEVKRVVQNLLLNAREAISDNGAIIVRTTDRGGQVELSVQDNGKGMSRDFMDRELFQPFHTTKSGGLGIGLFQSKKIMEAHRGSILVESEEGKGTRVILTFPTAKE